MRPRGYDTLHEVAGVYVIQFDGWVKVGMTNNLRARLRSHGKAGGTRARGWSVDADRYWIEEDVLAAMTAIGSLVRGREGFAGVTFGQAVDITRSAVTRRAGGPVHELDGFTIEIVRPLPLSNGWRYGWDGTHLLEVAS